jgi:hypothetical protein
MLQQTQVARVIDRYAPFLTRVPGPSAMAAAPLADVLDAWAGLGYYRRARDLHRAAAEMAAPGSPAQMYASYLADTGEARREAGDDRLNAAVETDGPEVKADGSIEWCYRAMGEEQCYTASDVELDASGLVVDLTINGQPLAGRIAGQGEPVAIPGGTVQVLSAFETSDGESLYVAVRLQAGDQSLRVPFLASFVGQDGVQVDADMFGSSVPTGDVISGARRTAAFVFPRSELPGRLVFQDVCSQDYMSCEDVTIDVG